MPSGARRSAVAGGARAGGAEGAGVATVLELDTPYGPARAHLHAVDEPRAALILGHGAGGGVAARDLVAATDAARAAGASVALVEQPYRVAGRRSAPPAARLDAAWSSVAEQLVAGPLAGLPLITGGRSSGARVACRTAAGTGAVGVLCLAFPLHPPRRSPDGALTSRLPELDAVGIPTLVVQGDRDPFGMPPAGPNRTVVAVAGDHRLAGDLPAVRSAVEDWVARIAGGARAAPAQ
jgi:predicted alpha/beta-hydrolase family hydrolase